MSRSLLVHDFDSTAGMIAPLWERNAPSRAGAVHHRPIGERLLP